MLSKFVLCIFALALILSANVIALPEAAIAGCKCKRVQEGETSVSLPILFATDREQDMTSKKDLEYGKQVIFPIDSVSYGLKRMDSTCTLPDDMVGLTKCGWLTYPVDMKSKKEKIAFVTESNTEVSHALAGFDELVAKTKTMLDASQKRGLVIYVHGCCLDFEGSMQQAADLASSVKVPVIAYSWGCSKGYAGSGMAFPRTQERFNRFLIQLLSAFPDEKICVVSNSIGSQIVQNFCLQRRPEDYGGRNIDEIIFSRADLDDVAFKSQLDSVARHSKRIVVYVAKNDFQINVSGTLRWFFFPTQHGERAGHLRSSLQIEPSLTVLDVSPLKMGHVIPYDSVADILDNNGEIPGDSRLYHYAHQEDNLYRVEPQESIFSHSASKTSNVK